MRQDESIRTYKVGDFIFRFNIAIFALREKGKSQKAIRTQRRFKPSTLEYNFIELMPHLTTQQCNGAK
jgi:hypothetical protein